MTLIHSIATGGIASTVAAGHRRRRIGPVLDRAKRPRGWMQPWKPRRSHRSTRHLSLPEPIPCAPARRVGIPDASLCVAGACASDVAGRHDDVLRDACADNVPRRDAATRDDESARTARRSRCCRDHSDGRSVPARRSGGSCRADRSQAERRQAPVPPRSTGQRTGGRRIKGLRKRLPRRCAPKAWGSTPINDRAFGSSSFCTTQHTETTTRNARALARLAATAARY
jgi:hypothetical protein